MIFNSPSGVFVPSTAPDFPSAQERWAEVSPTNLYPRFPYGADSKTKKWLRMEWVCFQTMFHEVETLQLVEILDIFVNLATCAVKLGYPPGKASRALLLPFPKMKWIAVDLPWGAEHLLKDVLSEVCTGFINLYRSKANDYAVTVLVGLHAHIADSRFENVTRPLHASEHVAHLRAMYCLELSACDPEQGHAFAVHWLNNPGDMNRASFVASYLQCAYMLDARKVQELQDIAATFGVVIRQ